MFFLRKKILNSIIIRIPDPRLETITIITVLPLPRLATIATRCSNNYKENYIISSSSNNAELMIRWAFQMEGGSRLAEKVINQQKVVNLCVCVGWKHNVSDFAHTFHHLSLIS